MYLGATAPAPTNLPATTAQPPATDTGAGSSLFDFSTPMPYILIGGGVLALLLLLPGKKKGGKKSKPLSKTFDFIFN